jgi:hypothetical protein
MNAENIDASVLADKTKTEGKKRKAKLRKKEH